MAEEIHPKGTKWIVGDEKSISLWNDWWRGEKALASSHPTLSQDSSIVSSIINCEGERNMSVLSDILSSEDINTINTIYSSHFHPN